MSFYRENGDPLLMLEINPNRNLKVANSMKKRVEDLRRYVDPSD